MYFLTDDEKRYLLRRLLPEARKVQVDETLRGWHWSAIDAPLRPTYSAPLGVSEVAEGYCDTARDVFVRRVLGQRARPSREMDEGAALHACAAEWVTAAKRLIYATPVSDLLAVLPGLALPGTADALGRKLQALRRFETNRLIACVQDILARQPGIGADALAAQALPVVVEQRVDGRFLGLSPHLSIDAVALAGPMVIDLKFGRREPFHRLATTGYALALESLWESPVDLGCLVYVSFRDETVVVERDFHFIDDELRVRFIDERDRKQRLVEEAYDPGLPAECYARCPHLAFCGTAARRPASRTGAGRQPLSRQGLSGRAPAAAASGPAAAPGGPPAPSIAPAAAPRRPSVANLQNPAPLAPGPGPSEPDYVPPSIGPLQAS